MGFGLCSTGNQSHSAGVKQESDLIKFGFLKEILGSVKRGHSKGGRAESESHGKDLGKGLSIAQGRVVKWRERSTHSKHSWEIAQDILISGSLSIKEKSRELHLSSFKKGSQ